MVNGQSNSIVWTIALKNLAAGKGTARDWTFIEEHFHDIASWIGDAEGTGDSITRHLGCPPAARSRVLESTAERGLLGTFMAFAAAGRCQAQRIVADALSDPEQRLKLWASVFGRSPVPPPWARIPRGRPERLPVGLFDLDTGLSIETRSPARPEAPVVTALLDEDCVSIVGTGLRTKSDGHVEGFIGDITANAAFPPMAGTARVRVTPAVWRSGLMHALAHAEPTRVESNGAFALEIPVERDGVDRNHVVLVALSPQSPGPDLPEPL
jgi:hypothetical protein